jgi:hypothetical protein
MLFQERNSLNWNNYWKYCIMLQCKLTWYASYTSLLSAPRTESNV